MARLDDAYSHQDRRTRPLCTTLPPDSSEAKAAEEERQKALADAAAIRPKLTNKSDIDMLDALVEQPRRC
jgi:hypothetical protein